MIPESDMIDLRGIADAIARTQRHLLDLYRRRQFIVAKWHDDGATLREIADALGVSRSRAQQLVHGTGRRKYDP